MHTRSYLYLFLDNVRDYAICGLGASKTHVHAYFMLREPHICHSSFSGSTAVNRHDHTDG
jgi:uncharacterized membrane protein YjjB (DUF3815 family)